MKNIHYHKAGFLVTLLSTFGMRALAEDDGSREQLALALGMSKEVLNTFAKPLLGMAGDSILKLSEDARSAIGHELNSHLEGAIKTAYKDALHDIEQEIVKELDLKEDRSQLWRRLLLNEASEKREAYEQMMLDFFIPLRAALSDETSIKDMLDTHQQLQPETYILHIIGTNLPAYAGTDRELFVADIAARFRKHYPHHFLQQLKKDNKAKTVYFTITLEALLRGGVEQKAMLSELKANVLLVIAELRSELPHLAEIGKLTDELNTTIKDHLDRLIKKLDEQSEPYLINSDFSEEGKSTDNNGLLFDYKYQYTAFVGRNTEMSKLQSFLESERSYCWWMIVGPGGMGKSRMALEIVKAAKRKGWNAGFYNQRNAHNWSHWNATEPTLIVLDYALTDIDNTIQLLSDIDNRSPRFKQKVRVLLLERIVSDNWKQALIKPGIRRTAFGSADSNWLELKELDSIWLIIEDVVNRSELSLGEKQSLLSNEKQILDDLYQIDPQRRPLFAFFAAKAMVYSEGKSIRGWNADRLLEFHLTRLETEYWAKSDIYKNNALAFKKQLLITTLCRQIPADQMQQLEKELQLPADSKSAYALITDDKANENNARGYYTGLQPDILAGYFIISTLNALAEGSFAGMGKEDADVLLQKAWGFGSSGCIQTIYLLWQDFIAGKEIVLIYDILKYLEENLHNQSKIQLVLLSILFNGIGEIHYSRQELQISTEYFDKAIYILPDNARAFYNRGTVKNSFGNKDGGIADYTEAIRLQPDYVQAFNNRGLLKNSLGDREGAIADFNEAIKLQPNHALAFNNRGNLKSSLDDNEGAIKDYDEAIRLEPDDAQAFNNRGVAKNSLGDREGAIADYNEAIRLQPDHVQAFNNRGNVKNSLGDKEGAITDYNEAIRLQPDYAQAFNNRGNVKDELGNSEGALADYNEAIRLQPDFAQAFNNRGVAKNNLGDSEGALADYTEAIRLQPDFGQAYYIRAYVKHSLRDIEGAIADYNEAIRLMPDDALIFYNRCIARKSLGDREGALADCDEAIRLQPHFARAFYDRGNLKSSLGDREGAVEDYTETIRLLPNFAQAYYNRGVVKNSLGEKEEIGRAHV